jgi:hypothetical protein
VDNFRLLSMPVRVRSTDARFAELLRWHLAPFRRPLPDDRSWGIEVYSADEDQSGEETIFRYVRNQVVMLKAPLPGVLHYAVSDLQSLVGVSVGDFLLLHAGAVNRNREGMLLPAPRNAGKSTLTLALLDRGFGYLSDEYGAIDPVTYRAYPFPKRISVGDMSLRFFPGIEAKLEDVREGQARDLGERYVRPEDLASAVGAPARVRWLVFPGHDRSGSPRLDAISKAEAVERMVRNSVNLGRYRDRGVVLLTRLAQEAEAFVLDGGDPIQRAELLTARIEA